MSVGSGVIRMSTAGGARVWFELDRHQAVALPAHFCSVTVNLGSGEGGIFEIIC